MTDGSVSQRKPATAREIDPAVVQSIVREVLARLAAKPSSGAVRTPQINKQTSEQTVKQANPVVIADRVITTATIQQHVGSQCELVLPTAAVVTPAARDLIRERGIRVHEANATATHGPTRVSEQTSNHDQQASQPSRHDKLDLQDRHDSSRGQAVREQLLRRGIRSLPATVVLSDTPAAEVCQRCGNGRRAVMVTSVNDIARFAAECDPTDWVLDMKRLNLVAATNVAAQISQIQPTQR